jgi:hypothetical protein
MLFNIANDFSTSPDAVLVGLGTTYKTQLSGLAKTANLRRGKVTEISVGPVSNPAATDCNIVYRIQRQTGDGGVAGGPINPIFVPAIEGGTVPTAGSSWKSNYTSEPNYNNPIWTKWLNQHSGFIWYAPDELGLPWAAVDSTGLAYMARGATSDYTGTVGWEVKFDE